MLDAIRFTAAAVAKKDFVPELTHFNVRGGRITGFNGVMSLSSPLDVDMEVRPAAAPFLAAVRACGQEPMALHVTEAGRLAVRAGKFRAYVPCLPEHVADAMLPTGDEVELGPHFLDGLRALAPVMGVDASRPWAMGVKLCSGSMFATNNVVMVQFWHGAVIPIDVVIPSPMVNELLRVGQPPSKVQVAENRVSFLYEDGRWIVSTVLEGSTWPVDKIEQILSRPSNPVPLPPDFFPALEVLRPFVDEKTTRVFLRPDGLYTSLTEGDGAAVAVELPVSEPQAYNLRQLMTLATVATHVDWSGYPAAPCLFHHSESHIRGAVAGQRY